MRLQDTHLPLTRRVIRAVYRKHKWLRDHVQKRLFRAVGYRRYIASVQQYGRPATGNTGQVYIDLSVIVRDNAATGIQRVVRTVAHLLSQRGAAQMPVPTFVYCHLDRYFRVEVTGEHWKMTDKPVHYQPGDTFLGLDFSLDAIWRMRKQLRDMRHSGVHCWYLVHDFLPFTHPQWFSSPTVLRFYNWLAIIAATADGFLCVSYPVARQLRDIMAAQFGRTNYYPIHVIPMGWDISASKPSTGLPDNFAVLLAQLATAPSILMVGTIEPRKGHRDVLDAMDALWASGCEINLVLVGGMGWKMKEFATRLNSHPQLGKRLHRPGKISDEALERLYQACQGLIFPSHAEGFGLPLIEALGHGKPVLARDLEVFTQHAGSGVTFFPVNADTTTLAAAIREWLMALPFSNPPRPELLSTWEDTAAFIADTVFPQTAGSNNAEAILE